MDTGEGTVDDTIPPQKNKRKARRRTLSDIKSATIVSDSIARILRGSTSEQFRQHVYTCLSVSNTEEARSVIMQKLCAISNIPVEETHVTDGEEKKPEVDIDEDLMIVDEIKASSSNQHFSTPSRSQVGTVFSFSQPQPQNSLRSPWGWSPQPPQAVPQVSLSQCSTDSASSEQKRLTTLELRNWISQNPKHSESPRSNRD